MADVGVAVLDDNLAAAGDIRTADELEVFANAELRRVFFAREGSPVLSE